MRNAVVDSVDPQGLSLMTRIIFKLTRMTDVGRKSAHD